MDLPEFNPKLDLNQSFPWGVYECPGKVRRLRGALFFRGALGCGISRKIEAETGWNQNQTQLEQAADCQCPVHTPRCQGQPGDPRWAFNTTGKAKRCSPTTVGARGVGSVGRKREMAAPEGV